MKKTGIFFIISGGFLIIACIKIFFAPPGDINYAFLLLPLIPALGVILICWNKFKEVYVKLSGIGLIISIAISLGSIQPGIEEMVLPEFCGIFFLICFLISLKEDNNIRRERKIDYKRKA